ncbi:MAG: PDDEXK nuclease domain-containing protein [Bacteroidota bacterium]|nr:PDDEXK nuclease domain-containing protein [Bacteroidota bacterium]
MALKKKSLLRKSPIVQQAAAQLLVLPISYDKFLAELKNQIREAQVKASLSVNRELVILYWNIGKQILARQKIERWGTKIIDRLSSDLSKAFPEIHGFSSTNLKYMRRFAETYPNLPFGQQLVDQIPWGHNIILLEKLNIDTERFWYAAQAIQNGWSRNVLVHQIESGLYNRQGKAVTNFSKTLPATQSDLAQQLLKDPYTFDFLSITEKASERDLEKSLVEHLKEFLLELGVGFAFVGQQYHMEIGGKDYYIDLLFYHTRLHCYVVIDLKVSEFQPEFAGKMNFYLSAIDDILCQSGDQPSIGIILCKSRNKMIVEYALRNTNKPIGVAAYRMTTSLPKNLRGSLPTIEELKTELTKTSPKNKKVTKRNRINKCQR